MVSMYKMYIYKHFSLMSRLETHHLNPYFSLNKKAHAFEYHTFSLTNKGISTLNNNGCFSSKKNF